MEENSFLEVKVYAKKAAEVFASLPTPNLAPYVFSPSNEVERKSLSKKSLKDFLRGGGSLTFERHAGK